MKMILQSHSIYLRLVEESDAEFICQLRNNEKLNTFISKSTSDVNAQIEWIRAYKQRETNHQEYYFIICRNCDDLPIGTVRLYDFKENPKSFCWGSWVLDDCHKTKYSALESALLVYEFGFNQLGFDQSHYDVMKGNDQVHSFHLKMGAEKTSEDDINVYYYFLKDKHTQNIQRYKRLLKV